ncbi:MAG TPA: PEP-CTERM sorting domain-containing protein [Pirellulales bacterium]|jgi:hypothetical protein|nr:PEP-CTERM sorting domain-containing protein [Pirellulales bacterium]
MRKSTLFASCASAIVVAFAVSATNAAPIILYSADFNSDTAGHAANFNTPATSYTDTNLVTASTAQDSWVNSSGLATNPLIVSGSATNGSVAMAASGEDDRATFSTVTAVPGTSMFYLSADINLSSVSATGDYFFNMGDGGASNFNNKVFAKSSGAGYVLGTSVNTNVASASFGSTVLAFGTTYHIVQEYDSLIGSGNDTTELYQYAAGNTQITPNGGDTIYASGAGTANDATLVGGVYLRQGSGGPVLTMIDNIVIATNVVPEPATLTLLGLSVIGLIGVARRKRS